MLERLIGQPQPAVEERSWRDEFNVATREAQALCPKLTMQQRLYGFSACFCCGLLLSFLGWLELLKKEIDNFAIFYTLGNVVALSSSLFFVGPTAQIKKMTAKKRWVATLMYFMAMGATLFVALYPGLDNRASLREVLVILCIMIQWCAMVWYSLSYIPFGRTILKTCCQKTCSLGDDV